MAVVEYQTEGYVGFRNGRIESGSVSVVDITGTIDVRTRLSYVVAAYGYIGTLLYKCSAPAGPVTDGILSFTPSDVIEGDIMHYTIIGF